MTQTLIIDYSWSGHTAALAAQLHQLIAADHFELQVPAGTFSQDMDETSAIAQQQIATQQLPALATPLPDLSRYSLILVGGPVWSGAPATPILRLLATADTGSAVLAPFYTHAGEASNYEAAFKQAAGTRLVVPGLGLNGDPAAKVAKLQQWLMQIQRSN